MVTNKKTCEVAVYFNKIPHSLNDFSFQCIDQVQDSKDSACVDKLLITKEAYWNAQLFSLASYGWNKRQDTSVSSRTLLGEFIAVKVFKGVLQGIFCIAAKCCFRGLNRDFFTHSTSGCLFSMWKY